MVEDALRVAIQRRRAQAGREYIPLPTFSGRLQPGVNLDSNAELLDLMEDEERFQHWSHPLA